MPVPKVRKPHVLLPDMSYACGGSILTKDGGFVVGTEPWSAVKCPECRLLGRKRLAALVRHQQGHGPHPDAVVPFSLNIPSLTIGPS